MSTMSGPATGSAATSSVDRVLGLCDGDLPAAASAAAEILRRADDPDVGVADLARVVLRDPGLTTRVMRLANSAYYGLSGRVSTPTFAVNVIGGDTLRAIAATAAAGIDGRGQLPAGYLAQAAGAAVGSSLVAPRVGVRPPEAHALGLLHNIGAWMLYRYDRAAYLAVLRQVESPEERRPLHVVEHAHFGTHGAEVGATLLGLWRFPAELVDAVAEQQEPPEHPRSPLAATLCSGLALAAIARSTPIRVPSAGPVAEALRLCRAEGDAAALAEVIRADARRLEESLVGISAPG